MLINRTATALLAAASVTILLGGCAQDEPAPSSQPTGRIGGNLTVFAAASLKSPFTELGEVFEREHPDASVEFSFAGSSDLVTQLASGAPGDVFASADARNMDKAVEADLIEAEPVPFASNILTIVTAPGNPKGIDSLADLADPSNLVVLCAPQVPCGTASQRVEAAAGVDIAPVSEESSVTDVLGKVTSGQADAGLVYVTDAQAAGAAVERVDFPAADGVINTYPIAVLKDSGNPAAAQAFVELVTSDEGQRVLAEAGFRRP